MQVAVIHSAFEDAPNTVAFVDVPDGTDDMSAMEYAYRWTNNVMGSWSIKKEYFEGGEQNGDYNDAVTVMKPLHKDESGKEWGHRSTSVGDQMLVGNRKYKVAFAGFEAI
jgi:hypothetical protein